MTQQEAMEKLCANFWEGFRAGKSDPRCAGEVAEAERTVRYEVGPLFIDPADAQADKINGYLRAVFGMGQDVAIGPVVERRPPPAYHKRLPIVGQPEVIMKDGYFSAQANYQGA